MKKEVILNRINVLDKEIKDVNQHINEKMAYYNCCLGAREELNKLLTEFDKHEITSD